MMKFSWKKEIAIFFMIVVAGLASMMLQASANEQLESDPIIPVTAQVETSSESGAAQVEESMVSTETEPVEANDKSCKAPGALSRSVSIEWIMEKKILTSNDKFKMKAKLEGFEEKEKTKVQWQYFVEGKGKKEGKWKNVKKNGKALIFEFPATKENLLREWRVVVTV